MGSKLQLASRCPLATKLRGNDMCLIVSNGVSSFENLYPTSRHRASVLGIPPMRAQMRNMFKGRTVTRRYEPRGHSRD
jgi:hypothetical protein